MKTRKRSITTIATSFAGVVLVATATALGAGAAVSGTPQDLAVSSWFTHAGHVSPLAAGIAYQASSYPLKLRVTPPDGSWGGAQWKSASLNKAAPFYGWVVFARGGKPNAPTCAVVLETAYARTASVAKTVVGLRTRGHGVDLGASSAINVAGFSGVQFDAKVTGKRHVFVPYSPPTTTSAYFPDSYEVYTGELLRLQVLSVRGKTVVVYIDNVGSPPNAFPACLDKTTEILSALKFPA